MHKVAVIVGSARRESLNKKLALALTRLGASRLEFEWVRIDDLPIYNGDLEPDRPASVRRFTAEVAAADAVLMVTPEHNRSISALLKNAIDWGSKPAESNVWQKPTAITGASPGAIGTAVAQSHLRNILLTLGAAVMGGEAYITFKPGLIDAEGVVSEERVRVFLQTYIDRFAGLVERHLRP